MDDQLAQSRNHHSQPRPAAPPVGTPVALDASHAVARARLRPRVRPSDRGDRIRLQSRRAAHVRICAGGPAAGAGGRPARLYAEGGELRFRRRLVDARRSPRLRAPAAGAAAREQCEKLLQLVLRRRHRARARRGDVDPLHGRENDRRSRDRPSPRVRHWPLGRRRDDLRHARHLSRRVRGRRHHRQSALWHRHQCQGGIREHGSGAWPRVSVWDGGADQVVKSKNADEIIKQWTDVHGLDLAPTSTERVDGYPRQVWRNPAGKSVIESYTITAMTHGTPLATGPSDEHVGVPGAFLLDVGISSSYHIAKFWGLTGHPRAVPIRRSESASIVPAPSRQDRANAETSGAAGDPIDDAPKPTNPRTRLIDVQAVITHALKAAGLMKS